MEQLMTTILNSPFINLIPTITNAILLAYYTPRNNKINEFEHLKAQRMDKMAEELLNKGYMTATEYYKTKNFLSIAEKADKYLLKNNPSVQESFDFDWYSKFYEYSGNISNPIIQDIWARIFAGQINEPNSCSYLTLEKIRYLSPQDSHDLNTLLDKAIYIDNKVFIPTFGKYREKINLDLNLILKFSEYGFISPTIGLQLTATVSPTPSILIQNNDLVLSINSTNDENIHLELPGYLLTSVGYYLAKNILNKETTNEALQHFKTALETKPLISVSLK